MIKSVFKAITLKLLTLARLRQFIFRLYPQAIIIEFAGIDQSSFLRILENFKVDLQSLSHAQLIRCGNNSDGGYVLDSRISSDTVCLSLGISTEVSFDLELSEFVKQIEMYDFSIDSLPVEIPKATFHKLGISGDARPGFLSLEEAISRISLHSPIILKMDIEGDEWDAIAFCPKSTLERCNQVIVEFHNLHKLPVRRDFDALMTNIREKFENFSVVNVHGNNWDSFHIINGVPMPNVIEVTYLRKDWLDGQSTQVTKNQQELNFANNPFRPDFVLDPFNRIL